MHRRAGPHKHDTFRVTPLRALHHTPGTPRWPGWQAARRPPHGPTDRTSLYAEITDKIIAELQPGRTLTLTDPSCTGRVVIFSADIAITSPAPVRVKEDGSGVTAREQDLVRSLGPAMGDRGGEGATGHATRRGESGTMVIYADRFVPDKEKARACERGAEPQAIPYLKHFTVFNAAGISQFDERLSARTMTLFAIVRAVFEPTSASAQTIDMTALAPAPSHTLIATSTAAESSRIRTSNALRSSLAPSSDTLFAGRSTPTNNGNFAKWVRVSTP
jgi:hypothetical protein